MNETCCPPYTIRCNATDFQLNNSHKKVLKKMRNFLTNGTSPPPKTLDQFVSETFDDPAHVLTVRLVDPCSKEFKESFDVSHQLYKKYQMSVHHDGEDECTADQFKRFLVKSPLQVSINRSFSQLFLLVLIEFRHRNGHWHCQTTGK